MSEQIQARGSRLIFVAGAPRSGTTLVQKMLDAHSDILGGPEFDHIPDMIQLRHTLHHAIQKGRIDFFCTSGTVDLHVATLIESLLLASADRHGCRLLSEKSPLNILVFDELLELFPFARFVNVVRDPRSVIASMLQVGKRAVARGERTPDYTFDHRAAITIVTKCLDCGFQAVECRPDRVTTIVYDRLVREPELEMRKLCEFLGVSFQPGMLRPSTHADPVHRQVIERDRGIWATEPFSKDPVATETEKWKEQLTPAQQEDIANAFRNRSDLKRLGFTFDAPIPITSCQSNQTINHSPLFAMRETARNHVQAGRYVEGMRTYLEIAQHEPLNAEDWHDLAIVSHRTGQIERA
ncbi:MAG: sulfotransferase, partial [Planctomycetes bacterium]|nr:sulfotransferase [Planctomycetota bacterium]